MDRIDILVTGERSNDKRGLIQRLEGYHSTAKHNRVKKVNTYNVNHRGRAILRVYDLLGKQGRDTLALSMYIHCDCWLMFIKLGEEYEDGRLSSDVKEYVKWLRETYLNIPAVVVLWSEDDDYEVSEEELNNIAEILNVDQTYKMLGWSLTMRNEVITEVLDYLIMLVSNEVQDEWSLSEHIIE